MMSMSMSFSLSPRIELRMAFMCGVCGDEHPSQAVKYANMVVASLVGTGPNFPYCPCCLADRTYLARDSAYQAAAERHVERHYYRRGDIDEANSDRDASKVRTKIPARGPKVDPEVAPFEWSDRTLGPLVKQPPRGRGRS